MTDEQLIQQLRLGSADAFPELVRRHVDWVYSAARRKVHDAHLAEDVTQAVFITLAKKRPYAKRGSLSPWLFAVLIRTCKGAIRAQAIRRRHESEAAKMRPTTTPDPQADWNAIAPNLEDAVARLRYADQQAILLRFYEQRSFAEVAKTLGITEEAARKRVSRAVETLRRYFHCEGLTVSTTMLGGVLSSHTTEAAPAALVSAISASPAATLIPIPIVRGTFLMTASTQLKVISAAAILLLIGGGGAVIALMPSIIPSQANATTAPTQSSTNPIGISTDPSPEVLVPFTHAVLSILAMSDEPINVGRWWRADGSPTVSPAGYEWSPEHTRKGRQMKYVRLFVRVTQADLIAPTLEIELAGGRAPNWMRYDSNRIRSFHVEVSVPTDLKQTDAILRLASGDWNTCEYDIATGKMVPETDEVTINSVQQTEDLLHTKVSMRFRDSGDSKVERRFIIQTVEGRLLENASWETVGVGEDQKWTYPVPKDQIAKLIYKSRPFEVRKLTNVSLEPGNMTKPHYVAPSTVEASP